MPPVSVHRSPPATAVEQWSPAVVLCGLRPPLLGVDLTINQSACLFVDSWITAGRPVNREQRGLHEELITNIHRLCVHAGVLVLISQGLLFPTCDLDRRVENGWMHGYR